MNAEDQRVWLNAAYLALANVPLDLLATAARAAMKVADHPSKIVPAITKAIEAERGRYQPMATIHRTPVLSAPVETEQERQNRLELAELMGGLARKLSANTGQRV